MIQYIVIATGYPDIHTRYIKADSLKSAASKMLDCIERGNNYHLLVCDVGLNPLASFEYDLPEVVRVLRELPIKIPKTYN